MTFAIETHGLGKVYRRGNQRISALTSLDLQVPQGAIFGFIGPNGAGKSTTIKIVVGLIRASAGHGTVLGHRCGTVPSRSRIGYLPETAVYHDFMTVAELIRIHAVLADIPNGDIPRRCEQVLTLVRLDHRQKSRLRELSKGMQQRFGLAQALLSEPELLILDEPTSGLDPMSQREVKDIILELRSRGITIFFSSHQLTDMEDFCDRVGIVHHGRLLACALLADLLAVSTDMAVTFEARDTAVTTLLGAGWGVDRELAQCRMTVPRARLYEAIDAVRAAEGLLIGVQPIRRRLEEAYFDLVAKTVAQ